VDPEHGELGMKKAKGLQMHQLFVKTGELEKNRGEEKSCQGGGEHSL